MKRLLIIILILGFIGCERFEIGSVDPGYMSIYKTKQDYSEFICVSLSSVDSKVFGHPVHILVQNGHSFLLKTDSSSC
jgi:hypothetical protein